MKHFAKSLTIGACAALTLVATASAHDSDDHDDSVVRDVVADYNFRGFDTIEVEGVYKLDVRHGDSFSVRTEATKRDAEWLDVTRRGDTLYLSRKDTGRKNWGENNSSKGVLAVITLPRLDSLTVAGVATGKVASFKGGDINVTIAGVSDLTLTGTCDELNIEMAGVGDVNASGLKCESVDAELGGVGELSVYASDRVNAESGGIGQIEVYGDPDVRMVSDGFMSKVKFR